MVLGLEVLKYAISLDLNMGYYRIHLSKEESNLCMIIDWFQTIIYTGVIDY